MKSLFSRLFTPVRHNTSRSRTTRYAFLWLSMAFFAVQTAAAQSPSILIFGDSLSAAYGIEEEQGWVTLLENRIKQSRFDFGVVNGSVSGETSTGGLARLPAMLANYKPKIVVLELGGNDGLRGLPLNMLEQNLAQMIELISNSGAETLLTGIQIPPNYGPRYTAPFAEIYGNLAKRYDLVLVPFLIDGIPQQPELMQADGIHPIAEAQSMILENVWPYLEQLIEAPSTEAVAK